MTISCYENTDSSTDGVSSRDEDVTWMYGSNEQIVIQNNPIRGPWFDNNRATVDEEDYALRLYSAKVEDTGVYVCQRHWYGIPQGSREVHLIVHGKHFRKQKES